MKEIKMTLMDKLIIMTAEKELEPQMESLFMIIENLNSDEIIDGLSFQAGWSIYYLKEMEYRQFTVLSPDYSNDPFEGVTEDLTIALWTQLEQVHFLRKLNIEGLSIKFSDKIILSKGVLELENIYLQRKGNVEQEDSGWFIGAVEEDDNTELYAMYAYQLLKIRPELIQVLALPNDYMVIFEGKEVKAVLNENDQDVLIR